MREAAAWREATRQRTDARKEAADAYEEVLRTAAQQQHGVMQAGAHP